MCFLSAELLLRTLQRLQGTNKGWEGREQALACGELLSWTAKQTGGEAHPAPNWIKCTLVVYLAHMAWEKKGPAVGIFLSSSQADKSQARRDRGQTVRLNDRQTRTKFSFFTCQWKANPSPEARTAPMSFPIEGGFFRLIISRSSLPPLVLLLLPSFAPLPKASSLPSTRSACNCSVPGHFALLRWPWVERNKVGNKAVSSPLVHSLLGPTRDTTPASFVLFVPCSCLFDHRP